MTNVPTTRHDIANRDQIRTKINIKQNKILHTNHTYRNWNKYEFKENYLFALHELKVLRLFFFFGINMKMFEEVLWCFYEAICVVTEKSNLKLWLGLETKLPVANRRILSLWVHSVVCFVFDIRLNVVNFVEPLSFCIHVLISTEWALFFLHKMGIWQEKREKYVKCNKKKKNRTFRSVLC